MKRLSHSLAFTLSIYLPLFISGTLILFIPQSSTINNYLSFSKVFWFSGSLFIVMNILGLLYGNPWHKEQQNKEDWISWDYSKKLIICYVSRGNNALALERAITATHLVLEDLNVN